jgi:hypothetical protein
LHAVWQRGNGGFTTEGVYTADRWRLSLSGGVATVTKEAFTSGDLEVASFGNATNYLKLDVTTGDNNMQVQQRLEDVTALAGQEVTISFYAKGTNPGAGAIYLSVFQIFGSGGSANVTAVDEPITYTGSWARYSHTFTMPSVSGKTVGTNGYLGITLRQGSGDTSTDAWELDIWGVQLEAGSIATPFKRHAPSLQGELAACQRYYYRYGFGTAFDAISSGMIYSTTQAYFITSLPVKMRAIPTVAVSAAADFLVWQGSQITPSAVASWGGPNSEDKLALSVTVSGATAGRGAVLTMGNTSTAFIEASAEL